MAANNLFSSRLIALIVAQLGGFMALALQLHGLLMLWILYNKHVNDMLIALEAQQRSRNLQNTRKYRERKCRRKKRERWFNAGRTEDWWNKMFGGEAPENTWRKNFRVSRQEFMLLLSELQSYLRPDPKSPNYRALSAEKKLAVTLYYLKDTGSLQMTANTFGISTPTVSHVIF